MPSWAVRGATPDGPNAAYDEAIRTLANALDQLSLQITHETTLAREYAQSGNRNAAAGTVTVIEPLLQDALGVCDPTLTMHRRGGLFQKRSSELPTDSRDRIPNNL